MFLGVGGWLALPFDCGEGGMGGQELPFWSLQLKDSRAPCQGPVTQHAPGDEGQHDRVFLQP